MNPNRMTEWLDTETRAILCGEPPVKLAPSTAEGQDLVINEIFYHPPEDRRGEFIELHNRGGETIDLSGFRFDKGIDYTFEEGVELAPGGYLVVAEDPASLAGTHGYAGALSQQPRFAGQ